MIRVRLNLRKVVAIAICLAGTTTMSAQTLDVFAAGNTDDGKTIWTGGVPNLGKVWKNNVEMYSVADGTYSINFRCIYVSGNDVYTGGTIEADYCKYIPAIWKNGVLLYKLSTYNPDSYVTSIYVLNGDVYACGDDNYSPFVWKNGKKLYTLSKYTAEGVAMQVIGNDVYATCYIRGQISSLWAEVSKNGNSLYTIDGSIYTEGIAVSGSDVYVAGYLSGHIAKVWKNGIELYSEDNADFTSIKVIGNDVYVAGYSNRLATVWKNGTVLYQPTTGAASNIFILNNDVYFLANYSIWKNGTELYNMGSQSANAIFVLPTTNTDIESIEVQSLQIYPNPVKDELFIQSETDINKIRIYDIAGKQILTNNLTNGKSINVSELPSGIYVLKIGNYSEKFVKE